MIALVLGNGGHNAHQIQDKIFPHGHTLMERIRVVHQPLNMGNTVGQCQCQTACIGFV